MKKLFAFSFISYSLSLFPNSILANEIYYWDLGGLSNNKQEL